MDDHSALGYAFACIVDYRKIQILKLPSLEYGSEIKTKICITHMPNFELHYLIR